MGSSSSTLSQADFNKMLSASGQGDCQCDLSEVKTEISTNTQAISGLSANGISDTVVTEINKAGGDVQTAIQHQVSGLMGLYSKTTDVHDLIQKDTNGKIIIGSASGVKSVQLGSDAKSPIDLTAGTIQGNTLTDGKATITNGGVTATALTATTSGININGGGMNVNKGGITISAGDLTATKGTVHGVNLTATTNLNSQGNLNVTGSATAGSLKAKTHGINIDGGGMNVTGGGITVTGGDLQVTGHDLKMEGDIRMWDCAGLTCPKKKGTIYANTVWAGDKVDASNVDAVNGNYDSIVWCNDGKRSDCG